MPTKWADSGHRGDQAAGEAGGEAAGEDRPATATVHRPPRRNGGEPGAGKERGGGEAGELACASGLLEGQVAAPNASSTIP